MKYFVVSDIHNFYIEFRQALKQAGFDKKNKEHILIICGDIFDRGSEALKLYNFIHSIPKSRRILIRGNHEYLFLALLNKQFPEGHDFSNGTVDTFCQIANKYLIVDEIDDKIRTSDYLDDEGYRMDDEFYSERCAIWEDIRNTVAESKITKWLKSKEWKDYYELDKYIFVHSFIPTVLKKEVLDEFGLYAYLSHNPDNLAFDKNWRQSLDWEHASWGCPYEQYLAGLFKSEEENGKVLVCGHWHTADFYRHLKFSWKYDGQCAPIYFSKGLIGLDGGCQYDYYHDKYIHPQNVLVIDESMICYDKFGAILEEMPDTEIEPESNKTSYMIPEDLDAEDISYCSADCKTACLRKHLPEGIHTVTDFSNNCSSFKKNN